MVFDLEKIFEDEFFTISLDRFLKFIQLTWHQHPDSKTYRRGFTQAAQVALVQECRFWLSDARAIHYLEFADQNWLLKTMVPLLKDSSLLKLARISSEGSLNLQDIDRILTIMESSPEMQVETEISIFMGKREALNWLLPKPDCREKVLSDSIALETSDLSQ